MRQRTANAPSLLRMSFMSLTVLWATKAIARHVRKIDLARRVVLITGGSRGLGLALAREVASRGARVALCARHRDELAAAREDVRQLNANVDVFPCDLRDSAEVDDLIEMVEATCGPIDLLINNAATISVGPAQSMDLSDFHEAMDANFWSALHTTLAVAPRMKARGGGRIVNIGSVGGKMPVPHLAPYCASKFALVGLSGALRSELARDGILLTTINPGLMNTGSPRNAHFKGQSAAEYAWFSISDSLPGLAMSAATAARKIVNAAIHGDAEVTLGWPAKVGSTLYAIAPSLHIELMALVNHLLPAPADHPNGARVGKEAESWLTQSALRRAGHAAEKEYNQLGK